MLAATSTTGLSTDSVSLQRPGTVIRCAASPYALEEFRRRPRFERPNRLRVLSRNDGTLNTRGGKRCEHALASEDSRAPQSDRHREQLTDSPAAADCHRKLSNRATQLEFAPSKVEQVEFLLVAALDDMALQVSGAPNQLRVLILTLYEQSRTQKQEKRATRCAQ